MLKGTYHELVIMQNYGLVFSNWRLCGKDQFFLASDEHNYGDKAM